MLPTFLGLGSGRCASTWLHFTLDLHPQINMTCHKEVNFWGRHCIHQSLEEYKGYFRASSNKASPASGRARVRGDISPRYCWLSRQSIRAIHRLMPDVRLILVMRNPVHRAWSHVLMEMAFVKKRNLSDLSVGAFLRYLERARHVHSSDYGRIIDDWTGVFPAPALHVGLYDQLCNEPRAFLREVLTHIGADADWEAPEGQIAHRYWTTLEATRGQNRAQLAMPPIIRWYLSMQWLDRVRDLNRRLDGRVEPWVQEIETAVKEDAPLSWKLRRLANRSILMWPERLSYGAFNLARECALAWTYRRIEVASTRESADDARIDLPASATVNP